MARHSRSKASRVRAPFVITASLALLAPACGGSASGGDRGSGGSGGAGGSSGSGGSGGSQQGCPTAAPDDGTSCAVSGKECYYDRCSSQGLGDLVATCGGGTWDVREGGTCNPPPPAECPTSEPTTGTYCEVPADQYCSYATSDCCPDVEARCLDNEWEVLVSSCNPPPPPPCPEEMPMDGASCEPEDTCGYTVQTCSYGTCSEGSPDAFTAFCDGTSWSVQRCQGV